MIDSYLTAGLTRGLSLALSPRASLHGREAIRVEERPVYREAGKARRQPRATIIARLVGFMSRARTKPEPACSEMAETANCRG